MLPRNLDVFSFVALTSVGVLTAGCAGPTTPFGAIHTLTPNFEKVKIDLPKRNFSSIGDARIPTVEFTPTRQKLHDRSYFEVKITDPAGFENEHEFQILHNGIDVTKNFMRRVRKTFSKSKTQMNLGFSHLRLLPDRAHKIEVLYWRSRWDEPAYGSFLPPTCNPFFGTPIAQLPDFNTPDSYIHLINRVASESQWNPYFMAGLIAQESSFNPKAVSWAKAIGLTQITPIAEKEIMKLSRNVNLWPRYPSLNQMSVPTMKAMILSGKVSGGLEWRLNPRYSIAGGAKYLKYLANYWNMPSNKRALASLSEEKDIKLGRLILASYNSGASRVNSAVQRHGEDWLNQKNLKEARKYVNRIFSFCHHFAENGPGGRNVK